MRHAEGWDALRIAALLAAGLVAAAALSRAAAPPPVADAVIYDGGLAAGWQDWSWASHELASTKYPFSGKPAIKMDPANYNGIFLHHAGFDTHGYSSLWFWVNGGERGNQQIVVCAVNGEKAFGPKVTVSDAIPTGFIGASTWQLIIVPLAKLKAADRMITGIAFQEGRGQSQAPVYLADIKLVGRKGASAPASSATPGEVTVTLDTTVGRRPISPLIYGMAGASPDYLSDLRLASNRWGGNPSSRYNWEKGNCWNAARDWEFRNGNYNNTDAESRAPSGACDRFVSQTRAAGAAAIVTIPMLGWVARDDNNESRSLNVPPHGGAPLAGGQAISGYDPAENRRRTSIRSMAHKPGPFQDPPDLSDEAVYQDEWVHHLVTKFGRAESGGVKFFAMDNEPDLWGGVHTDIHPVAPGYDDLLNTFIEYATAVKAVDPSAKVTGPVSWGWTNYFFSPRDGGDINGRPDRRAHGDQDFIPWWLEQVRKHDERTGKRTLDLLDVHFYPQAAAVYQGGTDAATNALRLHSTRALWDPAYTDESWIAQPVRLIPRLREWASTYYPGTKVGLTEWNWGADGTMNGALAIAECLGIFGREGLFLANYWTVPPKGSPGYLAFKLYRNADGAGTGVGDLSVSGVSSAPNAVGCYASVDSRTGQPALVLINKDPARDIPVSLTVKHASALTSASGWRLSGAQPGALAPVAPLPLAGGKLRATLPAYSVTLLRFR